MHPHSLPPHALASVDALVHAQAPFPYVYGPPIHAPPRGMHPPTAAPPQTWQAANGIAPQQTHMAAPQPHMLHRTAYREDTWENYTGDAIVGNPGPAGYDYRYRDDHAGWVPGPQDYYDPSSVGCQTSVYYSF